MVADPPRDRRRLFFSLWPSDACRAQLESATSAIAHASGGRIIPPRNFHVTLLFLGEVLASRIDAVQQLAGAITGVPRFDLRFDRVEAWPGSNVLCLTTSETPSTVIELADQLRYCLRGEQFRWGEQEFRPHVTLVRDLPRLRATESIEPLCWNVNEFVLVESRPGNGSTYSVIGRWPLPL